MSVSIDAFAEHVGVSTNLRVDKCTRQILGNRLGSKLGFYTKNRLHYQSVLIPAP